MAELATPARWDMGKGWRMVLVASLAVNLLVAGLLVGAVAGGGPGGRFRNADLATGPLVEALSDADRAAIRDAVRLGDRQRPLGGLRAEREALLTALRATPFDAGAIATVLDQIRDRVGSASDLAQAALVARIGAMTADDRAAFADRLERALQRGGDHGGRDRR